MKYKLKNNQEILMYAYESAQARMKIHHEFTAKCTKTIQEFPHFESEREALINAIEMKEKGCFDCQIWAKIDKDEEYYYIQDYYIVTDDNIVKQAAEYIGMAQIYDDANIFYIINDNVNINDVIA